MKTGENRYKDDVLEIVNKFKLNFKKLILS